MEPKKKLCTVVAHKQHNISYIQQTINLNSQITTTKTNFEKHNHTKKL